MGAPPAAGVLVGSLRAQRQHAREGTQRASAPAEADHPAVVGPFGVRPQLRARLPRLVHVLAELEEVPAGAFGLTRASAISIACFLR
jgi:hypothetical protein